jgi:hypothetical protein
MTAVTPSVSLTLTWTPPTNTGCLPITYYVLNKNGVDLSATITADMTSYTDDISTGGTIGTTITYMIKALNAAGASLYTEGLLVTVG